MIRALFFDLDGTLIDRQAAHRDYCLDLIARHPGAFSRHGQDAALHAHRLDLRACLREHAVEFIERLQGARHDRFPVSRG